jgi:hypothetical protein
MGIPGNLRPRKIPLSGKFLTFYMTRAQVLFFCLLSSAATAQIGSKVQREKITGVWQNSAFGYQMTLLLNDAGRGEFDGEPIQYVAQNSVLAITQQGETTRYDYSLRESMLTLSGGDLESPIVFTRAGSPPPPAPDLPLSQAGSDKFDTGLLGIWSGNGESIEFRSDGTCLYLGQTYSFHIQQGNVVLTTVQGNVLFGYSVSGNLLTLSAGGRSLVYSKGNAAGTVTPGAGDGVAQELVGRWCWINVHSTSTGGSSSSSCIVLNADGSYEYSAENSRSVNTSEMYGGTASQDYDKGMWRVQGDRLFYNSQSRGQGSYQLQKMNHPKTGDPMIVLDGEAYVTFYQKPPWR